MNFEKIKKYYIENKLIANCILLAILFFVNCFVGNFSYFIFFVLATMVAFSVWLAFINIKFIPIMIGMVLFFVSDLVLSMQYFGGSNLENRPSLVVLNHTLYYLAQCAVVIALLFL